MPTLNDEIAEMYGNDAMHPNYDAQKAEVPTKTGTSVGGEQLKLTAGDETPKLMAGETPKVSTPGEAPSKIAEIPKVPTTGNSIVNDINELKMDANFAEFGRTYGNWYATGQGHGDAVSAYSDVMGVIPDDIQTAQIKLGEMQGIYEANPTDLNMRNYQQAYQELVDLVGPKA